MQHTQLGRSGLKVSRLCLGTMNFGPNTSEADSFRVMDRALDVELNFFDTADVYGWKLGEGVTEQIVGRWFAQGGGRREKVVLATKFYGEMAKWPNHSRCSALHIRQACEASLRRLKTDYIDIYQMHHIDRQTPFDELWQALEVLVAQGKILYVGSSNYAGWHIARAMETARERRFLGLVSEQSKYSLIERTVELEVLPACLHYGVGMIPYSPLGGGLLAGSARAAGDGRRVQPHALARKEKLAAALPQYESLCASLGHEPANVALAWLLQNPAVSAPIIGPRTLEQLDGSLAALGITLDDETLARLDALFPGPGKPAPEAYAW
jgi:aryl-alcohol dehydrogenase-like predicted oxidoreductase